MKKGLVVLAGVLFSCMSVQAEALKLGDVLPGSWVTNKMCFDEKNPIKEITLKRIAQSPAINLKKCSGDEYQGITDNSSFFSCATLLFDIKPLTDNMVVTSGKTVLEYYSKDADGKYYFKGSCIQDDENDGILEYDNAKSEIINTESPTNTKVEIVDQNLLKLILP